MLPAGFALIGRKVVNLSRNGVIWYEAPESRYQFESLLLVVERTVALRPTLEYCENIEVDNMEGAMAVKPTFGLAIGVGVDGIDSVDGVESDLGFELVDLPSFYRLRYSITD